MTLDRWLAIVGLLIALPGFFELFLNNQRQTEAAVICFAAFVILCSALVVRYILKRPAFSAKSTYVKLELDKAGTSCKVTKRYRLRPNHMHADRLVIRHNGGRGGTRDFKWNGDPTVVDVDESTRVMGDFVATIKFSPSLTRGKWFEGELSYVIVDSFTLPHEFFIHQVEFAAPVVVEIRFPPDRPCITAQAKYQIGTSQEPVDDFEIKDGGKRLELALRRPKLGSEYRVYWDW
jgi:hypothetical protein